MKLEDLGWNHALDHRFSAHTAGGLAPARVSLAGRDVFRVLGVDGERLAELAGRLRDAALTPADLPVTGDWVACALREHGRATIHAVLPRASALSRRTAGTRADEQVLAANVDTLFLVCGLDGDFNPRRVERALAQAWESGATPVVLLNKADACAEARERAAEMARAAPGVDVHVVSALRGHGLDAVVRHLGRGRTAAFVGSSGVGKSTLVNRLSGRERQATAEVRADDGRGRHTTTARELFVLEAGGCLIDTPGLRELQLWADGEGLASAFADVAALAGSCRFRDCRHAGEPGCAVAASVDARRLASFHKLQREQDAAAARYDPGRAEARKARAKLLSRAVKAMSKNKLTKLD